MLTRPPKDVELQRLVTLFEQSRAKLVDHPDQAVALSTRPLGALPPEMSAVDAAAWTVVANVLLNLDEVLAKR